MLTVKRAHAHISNDACAKNYGVDIWNMYNDIYIYMFYRNNLKAIFNMYIAHAEKTRSGIRTSTQQNVNEMLKG